MTKNHKFVIQHKRRKILKIRFEVKETRLAVRPEKMVSTFPVSGSKEKYRNALTSKGSKFGRDWLGTYYQMRLASPARGKAPKWDTCATV